MIQIIIELLFFIAGIMAILIGLRNPNAFMTAQGAVLLAFVALLMGIKNYMLIKQNADNIKLIEKKKNDM